MEIKKKKFDISKITLGTAQFGSKYGIANISGKPDTEVIKKILSDAWKYGITSFDTAPNYGDSEEILGNFIKNEDINPVVITKISKIKNSGNYNEDFKNIKKSIQTSKIKLNISKIPICLLHHAPDMDYQNGIVVEHLQKLKNENQIGFTGVSAYTVDEVRRFLEIDGLDIIEIPLNIFDNELLKGGILKKIVKKKKRILARSIYLQGLFFIDPDKVPSGMKLVIEPLRRLRGISSEYDMTLQELAFLFVRDIPEISSLVIGVETNEQLQNNMKLLNLPPLPNKIRNRIFKEFQNLPKELIKPTMWTR